MRYAHTLARLKPWGLLGRTFRAFPLTSGRMRYAPTLDRLYLGVDESCASCIFAHIRAYAIRPYTCSIEILGLLDCVLLVFSLTSGRMRYAPTLVRLKLRLTISRQNRQMNSSDAGTGHTKPSNELILPWYGCDKTLKRFATMLTRVTQKGQTIPFTPR